MSIVTAPRAREALRQDARRRRPGPRRRPRARSSGSSARTAPARPPPCGSRSTLLVPDLRRCRDRRGVRTAGTPTMCSRVLGFMPESLRDQRRHRRSGSTWTSSPGAMASPAPDPPPDDRRPAGPGRPRPTSATLSSRALSRGMQQRLCLAHTLHLVHDPAVLVLDQPASGLDPRARIELRELLRELRSPGRDDPHLVPHILPELEELCTGPPSSTGDRSWRRAGSPTSSSGCVPAPCSGYGSWPMPRRSRRRSPGSATSSMSRPPSSLPTARSSLGSAGMTRRRALLGAAVGGGLSVVSFARAASDLEELFLQVTARDEALGIATPVAAVGATA